MISEKTIKKIGNFGARILVAAAFWYGNAEARLVQILHTNDTHSFLDGATHSSTTGGSARLKSLIDYYKAQAGLNGVKSLVLDGGDFLEGNLYYMADQGMKTFEAHNNVGYNMVALGNHDYLMGAKELDKMLGNIDLNFAFLAANVHAGAEFPNIRDKIKPYQEVEIDGIKIAVLGLTTDEFYFSWSLDGGSEIVDPYKTASEYEDILKKRNNDFIIALTHLGVKKDQKLAKKTSNIDLVVGGHSHTLLEQAIYEKNKRGIQVPIVQAGKHMEYLGRLVVDLVKGEPLKVVSYEVVPVEIDKQDEKLKVIVEEADQSLGQMYGEDWLEEVIGKSDLQGDDPSGSRKWAYYISDALREKTKADIAIH
ncbi:MAG: metallophosphatase, partial [Bdellovibrionales bacterium]|nr:metallophosphatase [Bdellovibrionales bacterium]